MARTRYPTIKTLTLITVIALAFPVLVSSAEKHGGDIWFKDTKKFPPVMFSHEKHIEAGNQCTDCHDSIFQKKIGADDIDNAITMKVQKKGKYCGTCHDGIKSFDIKTSCKKCHIKPES